MATLPTELFADDLEAIAIKLARHPDMVRATFQNPRFELRQFLVEDRVVLGYVWEQTESRLMIGFPMRLRRSPSGGVAVLQAYPARVVTLSRSSLEAEWVPDPLDSYIFLAASSSMSGRFPEFFTADRMANIANCMRALEATEEVSGTLGGARPKVIAGGNVEDMDDAVSLTEGMIAQRRQGSGEDGSAGGPESEEALNPGDVESLKQAFRKALTEDGPSENSEPEEELSGRASRRRIKAPTLH